MLLVSLDGLQRFRGRRIWQEAERPLREAIAVAAPRASRAISVAGIALAASFAMLAIVPVDGFREFAFMMAVGVLLETFLVRPVLIPALITLFGDAGAWPGRPSATAKRRESPKPESASARMPGSPGRSDSVGVRRALSISLAVLA